MKNLSFKQRNFWKWFLFGLLSILTLVGTFSGVKKSYWPFYQVKSGESIGINFCLWTTYEGTPDQTAHHQGLDLSFFTKLKDYSKIEGVGISFLRTSGYKSKENALKGLEVSVFTTPHGAWIEEFKKIYHKTEGVQIGLYNCSTGDNCFQIGIWNELVNPGGNLQGSIIINTNLLDRLYD